MPALLREAFGSTDLYAILGVDRHAPAAAVKKAYFKKALQYHPDKNASEDAKHKFQALSLVHSILSDPAKRKLYDDTGSVEEAMDEGDSESFDMWFDYWRAMFPAVTPEQIIHFERAYRGSDEEKADVLRVYEEVHGDMDGIIDNVMCSSADDEPRFVSLIHDAIATKTVVALPAFTDLYGASADAKLSKRALAARKRATTTRKTLAKEEEESAMEELEKMKTERARADPVYARAAAHIDAVADPDASLKALIASNARGRARGMDSLLSRLESKYGEGVHAGAGAGGPGSGASATSGTKRKRPGK